MVIETDQWITIDDLPNYLGKYPFAGEVVKIRDIGKRVVIVENLDGAFAFLSSFMLDMAMKFGEVTIRLEDSDYDPEHSRWHFTAAIEGSIAQSERHTRPAPHLLERVD